MLLSEGRIWAFVCLQVLVTLPTLAIEKDDSSALEGCPSPDSYVCQESADSREKKRPLCVPKLWLCDGDQDCENGDDEFNCTNSHCASHHFQCSDVSQVRCIPQSWQCDGENDCDLGEDEAPEICRRKSEKSRTMSKKGTWSRGNLVDNFKCPNKFRCPKTQTCISVEQVCDGTTDCESYGADEGPHCINRACRVKKCPGNMCKETYQGPMCYCEEGKEYNNSACIDLNECNYPGFCDQMCVNFDKGYNCSCKAGYQLVGKGSCKISDKAPAPVLVVAGFRNITLFQIPSNDDRPFTVVPFNGPGYSITAMDVDVKNNSVCWVTHSEDLVQSKFVCARVDNSAVTWEIKTQYALKNVKSVAKDWISGNWYFSDEFKEVIFFCTSDGSYCQNILSMGIKRPKRIAVDSTKGFLFYCDWSSDAIAPIGRLDLDGSNHMKLASIKIAHPNGLTLDLANSHVYWGDSYLDVLERMDYNGRNRMVIAKGRDTFNVFGMTILENYLYVADDISNKVIRIHRFHSDFPHKDVISDNVKPSAMKLLHSVMQPIDSDTDVCTQAGCEQICIPIPNRATNMVKASCICKAGYTLVDQKKCEKRTTKKFFILTNGQQGMIHFVSTELNEADLEIYPPIANLGRPKSVDFDSVEGYIYFYDNVLHSLRRRKFDADTESEVFVEQGVNCDGLAVDWLGRNVYCADTGRNKILAISIKNSSYMYTLLDSEKAKSLINPKALAIDHRKGTLYWTDWVISPGVGNPSINSVSMDGSQLNKIESKGIQWPNGLVLDAAKDTLYWTEAFYDRIESMSTTGERRKTEVNFTSNLHPYGLTKLDNRLLWAESMDGSLMQLNLSTSKAVFYRNGSAPVFDVKLYDDELQPRGTNPCANNHCSDLCLLTTAGGHVCRCADGRTSTDDGVTCTGNVAPRQCQKILEFQCKNGDCIHSAKTCDGHFDCKDHSDEDTSSNGVCANRTCHGSEMFACNTSICIYLQFRCDGEPDCAHGEDEQGCDSHTCSDDHIQCQSNKQCIPRGWKCDGEKDCPDGSDEDDHVCCQDGKCGKTTCGHDQFQCLDGRCISYEFRCDNEYDCKDNSDELDCGEWCDPIREFKCVNESRCIPKLYKCDGENNCLDGADEKGCEKRVKVCKRDEFACTDGTCIKSIYRCDVNKDCLDGSDEMDCSKNTTQKTCHWSEFKCADGEQCIPSFWQCDDEFDCKDKSDEKGCAKCHSPNFACKTHETMCIPPEKLCDNQNDCPDHSDEGRLCEYDMCLNHDCEYTCHKSPEGFLCSCPPDKILKNDNKTCMDINACEKWGTCSQLCQQTPNGHHCYCNPGYTLESDHFSCKPNDNEPLVIIFANRHEIRLLDLKNNTLLSPLVSSLQNAIALDFRYSKSKSLVFWTDVNMDKIFRGEIYENSVSKIEPIVENGLATTEGIAVDWIANNIYWVESSLDQIEVAKLDGSSRATLIAGNITNPRAIVLDPRVGKLFWTDWDGHYPRIESCSMAGEDNTRKIVYDIRNLKGAGWPNGLTVDYDTRRLYWVDARSDSIHTITYDGDNYQLVLKSNEQLNHPFSLTVFGNYVYWTDWRFNSLVKANKFNGNEVTVLYKTYQQPFDLQMYHPMRQPQMINPCLNSKCSHLCLIGDNLQPVCRCPHRFKLKDKYTCEDDKTYLLFTKESEIRGVSPDNAHYNVIPSITVPYVENASSLAFDFLEDRLYWTDIKKNVITSGFLNGTGITTVIDSGLSNPFGIAIDWVSRNMYFSSYTEEFGFISVAKLDGAYRKEIYRSTTPSRPTSIAIHPSKGIMFWTDLAGDTHSIWKANMDGTEANIFVKGIKKPSSLAVDMQKNRLYWISLDANGYFWCDVSSKCNPSQELSQWIKEPLSITFYTAKGQSDPVFFFYNKNSSVVKYANKTVTTMRQDTPNVSDLKIYDPASVLGVSNQCVRNNGGCEQLCFPSPTGSVCECTVGYELVSENKCKGINSFILYTQGSEIHGLTLGTKQTPALASISKISRASSVDFYAEKGEIYWVDSELRLISRIKRDLSGRQIIVSQGISGAESLAVDWIAGNIYWTDQGHNTIEVTRLDGTKKYVLMHEDIEKPRSIVVNPLRGYLYFANGVNNPSIIRARLDGSERKNFVISTQAMPLKAPDGLAVDYETDDLYWCDKGTDMIEKVTPTGERFQVLKTNLTDCMSVAVHNDKLFWADGTDLQGSIKYMNKDTSKVASITVLKTNIFKLKDIKIFDSRYQNGTNPCSINSGGCQELCLYRGQNKYTCACSHGKLKSDGKSCDEHSAFLLYSEVTSLRSFILDNTTDQNAPRQSIQNETNMKNVIGLTFDYATERIFFSDIQQGNIQSVFFNGTGFKIIVENVGSAEGLAYDPFQNHLYWTSYSGSSVNRISFKQKTPVTEVFYKLDSTDHPRDIVVNSCIRRIFWTNWSERRPSIQTASYNSEGKTNTAESIITDKIRTPNGLAIDHKGQKLYWSDARLDKIERCNFDGSNRIVIVSSVPQHAFGLAVYGDFIYWTDWMLRALIRVNKYDGSDVTFLKKNISRQPMGIIAVANDTDNCKLNPCFENAFGCAEKCLVDDKGNPYCKCGPEQRLHTDGKRCLSTIPSIQELLKNCEADDFICEDRQQCIPFNRTCNDIPDCLDASDESVSYCTSRTCPINWHQCQNSSRCIMMNRLCDSRNDCGDGSDELGCACAPSEFQCTIGMCILAKYRCDFDSDCPDHSDEIGCNKTCAEIEIGNVKHAGLVSCNTTSMCIYPNWICDGSNDCWDNNDEANCETIVPAGCTDHAFTCDDGKCILLQWRCDSELDCTDGSDEKNCTYSCGPDQFKCEETVCIPKSHVCDGREDCPNGIDEKHNCSLNCTDDHFRCDNGVCISREWLCDGEHDCSNGEDERMDDIAKCEPTACSSDQFLCLNRRCIRSEYYCDGDNDCGDNSDEPSTCVPMNGACSENEFQCKNDLKCIPASKRCNGRYDCQDSTDEIDCSDVEERFNFCQNKSLYPCDNQVCIEEDLLCNGKDDCGDNSDEPINCGIDECKSRRPVCSQVCVEKKIGYECRCNPGYTFNDTLDTDTSQRNQILKTSPNRKCVDVDECLTTYPCSQYCTNTIGSFKCSCADGYMMLPDGRSCVVADGIEVLLLVSNRYYLRLISTNRNNVSTFTSELKNSVAVDYDWKEQMVYWSDITNDRSSISRMGVNFTSRQNTTAPMYLHTSTVRNPDGLAVDWVGRNLYWCDKTTDTIEVSKLDGRYRKVLLRKQLQEPRAIEVFPQKGLLFFTDWGSNPQISRMNMDGTDLRVIVNQRIVWPNGLTIDYVTEKLFWGDGYLDYIGMSDLDGQNFRYIIKDNRKLPHVFALGIFEGLLYWTDWERSSILSAYKFSGSNITRKTYFVQKPMDIHVVHPLRQVPVVDKQGLSPCDYKMCTHLCLLRPAENGQGVEAVCDCPENHYLAEDKRSCVSNCTSSQILCATSSTCIPFWWKCDNHRDCEDGSDEPEGECEPYHCSSAGMFQCGNATSSSDCLLPNQICDGTQQCTDKSDELYCANYTCMDHYFKCHQDNICIPQQKVCDGQNDCPVGKEDEKSCEAVECLPGQFSCNNSRCIPYVWKCDGDHDCTDKSDEDNNCMHATCPPDFFKCKSSGRCIHENWKCDGDADCGDQDSSDESDEECHGLTCEPTFFRCTNGHCIPGRWRCDNHDDCRDGGSDEMDCYKKNCTSDEFMCQHGKCIPLSLKCNGVFDCADRSDELKCALNCNKTEFKCSSVAQCIPLKWQCDGETDCTDGTDELNCTRSCTEKEFKCNNTLCKPRDWQCDGDDDCGDNSDEDETFCSMIACPPGKYRCKTHKCIWNSMVCNGHQDCLDGDDEDPRICSKVQVCGSPNFACDQNTKCLHLYQVCDNNKDCSDGSDENKTMCEAFNSSKTNNCSVNNGGCQHGCVNTSFGPLCTCKENYVLNPDGMTCSVDNPCNHYNSCSQYCEYNRNENKKNCTCAKGYKAVDVNDGNRKAVHQHCLADGQEPRVLIAQRDHVILRPTLYDNKTEIITPTFQTISIISIDMDIQQNTVFYINHTSSGYFLMKSVLEDNTVDVGKRMKRQLSSKAPEILQLNNRQLFEMGGLAVDWIGEHIYLTDVSNRAIYVYKYQALQSKLVVKGNMASPYAIAVDPIAGYIFWTDRGSHPKIERANLDGTDRTVIISHEISWPNGLALDHFRRWIYWTDTKKNTVEAARYDGTHRQIIFSTNSQDPPFSIDLFEDYIYVLTHKTSQVMKVHKFDTTPIPLFVTLEHALDLIIVQDKKQPIVMSNCTSDKSPCLQTQMCINKPQDPQGYVCLCPDGAELKGDKCNYEKPAACVDYCENNGDCEVVKFSDKPKCSCMPHFYGERCEKNACTDYCPNGNCSLPNGPAGKPVCKCKPDFSGDRCEIYNCAKYCLNGGMCKINSLGDRYCFCPPFYGGPRCENKLDVQDWCPKSCKNGANCTVEKLGHVRCDCKPGFTGKRCDQCTDLTCSNGGTCYKDLSTNVSKCKCFDGQPGTPNCDDVNCAELCFSGNLKSLPDKCDCDCLPTFLASDCLDCQKSCPKNTVCRNVNGISVCVCDEIHSGPDCETCKCGTTGQCTYDIHGKPFCNCSVETFGEFCQYHCVGSCGENGHCALCFENTTSRVGQCRPDKCVCKPGFSGKLCEAAASAQNSADSNPLMVYIPIAIVAAIIIIIVIVVLILRKKKGRLSQYGHKRMDERNNMNVTNPVYMKRDAEDDDEDENEPLRGGVIFTGETATNFANPMYDVYSNDSSQKLLSNGIDSDMRVDFVGSANERELHSDGNRNLIA
ncbi:prolow-density lipoprotein receptor-related protein 1-like [Physella acuta]|uniref:prolow-density lipoprotein receptor-related protein 1-like n=1 Tax=Physella acuta TaxID=109671 RepID=UPI0027DB4436|nr:prolow-density lipoprotein receptor-related protein 1-like [Physella acuta]